MHHSSMSHDYDKVELNRIKDMDKTHFIYLTKHDIAFNFIIYPNIYVDGL